MRPHEKLDVWRRSVDFAADLYQVTRSFSSDERFGLVAQIRRAGVSVPANIAEGAARQTHKEFVHFLHIAQGSLSEIETELLIAKKVGLLNCDSLSRLEGEAMAIRQMLGGLIRHLNKPSAGD